MMGQTMNNDNAQASRDQASADITLDRPANDTTAAVDLIVSLQVGGQLCGLPVQAVRDVLGPQTITRVPLAAPEIAGNINLRGRIVTTIDLRKRLNLSVPGDAGPAMSVVTEHGPELYALLVDRVPGSGQCRRTATGPVATDARIRLVPFRHRRLSTAGGIVDHARHWTVVGACATGCMMAAALIASAGRGQPTRPGHAL